MAMYNYAEHGVIVITIMNSIVYLSLSVLNQQLLWSALIIIIVQCH